MGRAPSGRVVSRDVVWSELAAEWLFYPMSSKDSIKKILDFSINTKNKLAFEIQIHCIVSVTILTNILVLKIMISKNSLPVQGSMVVMFRIPLQWCGGSLAACMRAESTHSKSDLAFNSPLFILFLNFEFSRNHTMCSGPFSACMFRLPVECWGHKN